MDERGVVASSTPLLGAVQKISRRAARGVASAAGQPGPSGAMWMTGITTASPGLESRGLVVMTSMCRRSLCARVDGVQLHMLSYRKKGRSSNRDTVRRERRPWIRTRCWGPRFCTSRLRQSKADGEPELKQMDTILRRPRASTRMANLPGREQTHASTASANATRLSHHNCYWRRVAACRLARVGVLGCSVLPKVERKHTCQPDDTSVVVGPRSQVETPSQSVYMI